jgi:hypothetical protein
MHEGYWSTVLGLQGWPAAGEEMIVARNVLLAELTGGISLAATGTGLSLPAPFDAH